MGMNNATTAVGNLMAIRTIVTDTGAPVCWMLYDLGNGRARKEVVDVSTGKRIDSLTWVTRLSTLRAEKPLPNRCDSGWQRVA